MRQRGSGHVVNLASIAGKGGFPGVATYCGTKHAVVGISEAVRAELDGTGIEMTVVMPSFVNTELIFRRGDASRNRDRRARGRGGGDRRGASNTRNSRCSSRRRSAGSTGS